MKNKTSLAKGTRDFGPKIMLRRKYILKTIETEFQSYGFLPIETPAIEQLDTLSGKYGEEGDKLLFKILNSGNYLKGVDPVDLYESNYKNLAHRICEKGLRYDLTVPLARFVAMNRQELVFPFKRYQMQPVWRADRPQKGRYREFWQCDADVIGSGSLLFEADFVNLIDQVFTKLGISYRLELNNRKILEAIANRYIPAEKFTEFVILLDKLDKVSFDTLVPEFREIGIMEKDLDDLKDFLIVEKLTSVVLEKLRKAFSYSEKGIEGCNELLTVLELFTLSRPNENVFLNLSLARGLDYYTGTIFEVKAKNVSIGSILGGGRYDNLTGVFGLPDVSGVGISFGIDRIYDVMDELNLFAEHSEQKTKALFCHFDEKGRKYNQKISSSIRSAGIFCEVYPDFKKLPKQFDYAESKGIEWVLISGEQELENGTISYKNLLTKEQGTTEPAKLIELIHPKSERGE
ncbi:MAG: histidine--tRNA ligase [Flavobacteriales bacterium]|nr:histidine--tRNA ligase [Flavobacteriales bacterium]